MSASILGEISGFVCTMKEMAGWSAISSFLDFPGRADVEDDDPSMVEVF